MRERERQILAIPVIKGILVTEDSWFLRGIVVPGDIQFIVETFTLTENG